MEPEASDDSNGLADAPILDVEDLEVGYGAGPAVLKGISLTVPSGGAMAVLGPNGAGKTTLIRAVSGLLPFLGGQIRAGDIRLEGQSIKDLPPHVIVQRGVGQVPEGRMLFSSMTVEENLRVGAVTTNAKHVPGNLKQVYELFPVLGERRNQVVGWMSGGEQQMVAVGRALMARPKLLLLDEVSLGLAPKIVKGISARLRTIRSEFGSAFLLVEQNAALALSLTESACVIENGKVLVRGKSEALRTHADVRKAYLGQSLGGEA